MKHVGRIVKTIFAVLVVAVPTILVDPSFGHYVAQHPWAASALPVATGIVRALLTAWQLRGTPPAASPAPVAAQAVGTAEKA